MKNEIDLTKLTKEEIERDFVIRCGAPFYFIGKFKGDKEIGLAVRLNPNEEAIIRVVKDGKRNPNFETNYDLIPRPVETFERDEKVMASMDKSTWVKKHYCKRMGGRHYCYCNGVTSWTAEEEEDITTWEFVRKPTPEELAK